MYYNMAQNVNNHFIQNHMDHASMNTFNNNLKAGDINPLLRKSIKKVLNINTRFRDNYSTTESTNFGIILPETIKKVVSMKLVSCEVPHTVYTVSDKLGSNSFKISLGDTAHDISNVIKIPPGSYTGTQMVTVINNELKNADFKDILATYNPYNGIMNFVSTTIPFNLDFNYQNLLCQSIPSNINKDQLTLGWLLGFRGNYAYGSNQIKSKLKIDKGGAYKYSNIKHVNTQDKTYIYYNNYCEQTNTNSNNNCFKEYVKDLNNLNDLSLNKYVGDISYSGDSLYNEMGNQYFLLSVNDYKNNHDNPFMSPFKQQSLADNNIIAKVSAHCCTKPIINYPERIYFGPTNISKLHIILYDECGRIVDINNSDYSFTIEFEVLYDL